MSRPEQKARPEPVMTMTRTVSSKFACQITLRSSRSMRSSKALSFAGRARVMTRMPSSTRSVLMVSNSSTCSRKPFGLPCSSSATVGAVLSVMRVHFLC